MAFRNLVYIEPKANSLSSTATTQSTSELGSTKNTDLKSDNKAQDGLAAKAEELKQKASALNGAANTLATSGPSELRGLATNLRDAAKGTDGLHHHAEQLAEARNGQADSQANGVIQAFDKVEKQYDALIKQANEHGLTNDPKVIAVVKAYHAVKNIYYQMLIVFRIKQKANAFHKAANTLKQDAEKATQENKPKLKALHTAASNEMQQLVDTADTLKDIDLGAQDSDIVNRYLAVETYYKALEAIPAFKDASEVAEVTKVKTAFDSLQNSYENVLKLRVQELAKKSETLKNAANTLKTQVPELSTQAENLKDAASNGSGQKGLKEKAAALVTAINTDSQIVTNAIDVIKQFEAVTDKYNLLTTDGNYDTHKTNPSVKAVDAAYTDLNKHYDTILNVKKATTLKGEVGNGSDDKILKKAKDLYTKASLLAGAPGLSSQPEDTQKAELKKLAEALKTAVGASVAEGLQGALNQLKSATNDALIVEKALEVIKHYGLVKDAYDAVKAKETQYTTALKGTGGKDETDKYTDVTSAFQALQFCPP